MTSSDLNIDLAQKVIYESCRSFNKLSHAVYLLSLRFFFRDPHQPPGQVPPMHVFIYIYPQHLQISVRNLAHHIPHHFDILFFDLSKKKLNTRANCQSTRKFYIVESKHTTTISTVFWGWKPVHLGQLNPPKFIKIEFGSRKRAHESLRVPPRIWVRGHRSSNSVKFLS